MPRSMKACNHQLHIGTCGGGGGGGGGGGDMRVLGEGEEEHSTERETDREERECEEGNVHDQNLFVFWYFG